MGLFDFLFKRSAVEEKFDYLSDKVYSEIIKDDDLSLLNDNEKVFFVIYLYNLEIQNGGLCQFFVNSSRAYATLISQYLEIIGALEHKMLYDDFVKENNINLLDLSFFDMDDLREYEEKANSYPFDRFDDAFCELTDIEELLEEFMNDKL